MTHLTQAYTQQDTEEDLNMLTQQTQRLSISFEKSDIFKDQSFFDTPFLPQPHSNTFTESTDTSQHSLEARI
jgi:hypothetical protein